MEGGIPILKRVGLNYFAPFITQSTFLLFLARAVSHILYAPNMALLSKYSTSGPLERLSTIVAHEREFVYSQHLTTLNMDSEFYGIVIIIISMR